MKTLKLTLAVFLTTASLFMMSCSQNTQETTTTETTTTETQPTVAAASLTLSVEGMSCENCANALKTGLSSVAGVTACNVNFENKTATVEFDNSKTTEETIMGQVATIHDGKFKVAKASTEPTAALSTEHEACDKNCTKPCCKGKEGETKTCTKESKDCCKKDAKTSETEKK